MNRRKFAQRTAQAAALTFFPVSILSKRPVPDELSGHGDYRYRVHRTWGNLDPKTVPVNNCHEMVQDRSGRLIMIGDELRNNILICNRELYP